MMLTRVFDRKRIFIAALTLLLCATVVQAQTTAFTYQGKLSAGGNPANGSYDMQFKIFDALTEGTQQGATITNPTVAVSAGLFTVELNFGSGVFDGTSRFLEIGVRPAGSPDPYTVLAPRQPILSMPYAVKSLSATQADISLDANKLGGIAASEYVTTSSVGNTFIKNAETQQNANFNISGNGTLGGALTANTVTAQTGTGLLGLTQTDGTTMVGTYIGGSGSGAAGGWFGTVSNSPLHFFTNNGQPQMTILQNGDVGIGTFTPQAKLHVAGNAVQDRDKGGMVKAMLYVDGTLLNPSILRCYNGVTGASTGTCGFTVSVISSGSYNVSFGFPVFDRFVSVTAQIGRPLIIGGNGINFGANFRFNSQNNTILEVYTFYSANPENRQDGTFMLIVY